MISTRDLSGLPDIRTFRRLTRSLAMLDAVLLPGWEYRYHSFDAHWAPGELMASMRNGQGDGEADSYRSFVAECYEIDVARDAVASIYGHAPVTGELIARLNPDVSLADLGDDIAEIGYPDYD